MMASTRSSRSLSAKERGIASSVCLLLPSKPNIPFSIPIFFLGYGAWIKVSREYWPFESCKPCIPAMTSFILSYFFYRRRIPGEESEGLLFAALVCINPTVFSLTDFTVSDILFLSICLAAFVIFDAAEKCAARRGSVTLSAVIVALGCLTRSAGVPLAVAGAIHFVWNKRYRDLTHYVCLVVLFVIPWWLWVGTHSNQMVSSLLDYYVSYSSNPPHLQSCGSILLEP